MAQNLDEHFFDPDFAIAYEAALADYSSLSDVEKRQFNTHVGSFLNIFEYSFYAHDRGIMDDEIWAGWERWMNSQFQLPAWQQVWRTYGSGYGDRFQAFVDAATSGQ